MRKLRSYQTSIKPRRETRMAMIGFVDLFDDSGEPLANATMREISKTGAQLQLKSPAKLPQRILIRSSSNRECHMATVKWVSGNNFGVEFDEVVKVPNKKPNAEERIRIVTSHLAGKAVR